MTDLEIRFRIHNCRSIPELDEIIEACDKRKKYIADHKEEIEEIDEAKKGISNKLTERIDNYIKQGLDDYEIMCREHLYTESYIIDIRRRLIRKEKVNDLRGS